jgi:3-hydroxybutyryl-CoA dehydrogenase
MQQTVGIIGAGQMGSGIAQVFALAGYKVMLNDISQERIEAGIATINGNLARQVAAERIDEAARSAATANLVAAANLTTMADANIVIEAASENENVKVDILREVSAILSPETIIASNTSSISITRLAASTDRPEKFIGMHFMNPVPVMELVEIIRGIATDDATYEQTVAIVESLNKTSCLAEDFPAFIVNRILLPMINEAGLCAL